MKRIILIFLALNIGISAYSQLLQGEWRDHLPFHEFYRIAITDNIVYSSSISGLLSYNKSTNEINKITKANGAKDLLSDVEISTISYSEYSKYLVIGYKNGNIDVMNESGEIQNLSDLKNKNITGSKKINRIIFNYDVAYLACDFGIVAVDLTKMEFKGNYYFGPGGSSLAVNDITIIQNYIYAATSNGIYLADLNSPNLVDYNYWVHLDYLPQSNLEYKFIVNFNNKIYSVYYEQSSELFKLITISDNSYQNSTLKFGYLYDLSASGGYLCFSGYGTQYIYDTNENLYLSFYEEYTNHIYVDKDKKVYVASGTSGFFIQNGENQKIPLQINSPVYSVVSKVATKGDQLWVTSGEPDNDSKLWVNGAFYNYSNNLWKTYTIADYPSTHVPYYNTYKVAFDPGNINHFYACSERYGILEFLNGIAIKAYDNYNWDIFSHVLPEVGIRAANLQYDSHNNLWMALSLVAQPIFKIKPDGTWENPKVTNNNLTNGTNKFSDFLVTKNDDLWITSNKVGIIVLRDDGTGHFLEKSFAIKNQEGEVLSKTYCMNEDHDGNIWIGTSSGPIIYYNPSHIFDNSDVFGTQVKLPRNDGTSNADFLLSGEVILDIKTDGANRKWIATDKSGVFLISEDGKKTIENFRYENSPLLSDNVSGIGIKENGEVFFATNMGLISFKGTATEGFDDYNNVYVYPNPVRPDFNGNITVTGLIENSNVKITDVSGNLVYETTSLGGQAIWNGCNFNGKKVATGVYLIFLSTENGEKSHMTKLLFMH